MGAMLDVQFDRAESIDWVLAQAMREARRRARMGPATFAAAINRHVETYDPGLTGESVQAMEAGLIPPGGDVLLWAMWLGGHDVVTALVDWVRGTIVRPCPRPPFPPSGGHGASAGPH